MGKKKKEHAGFEQMISKKNNTPFAKVGNKYSAQAAPKKNDTAAQDGGKVNCPDAEREIHEQTENDFV